MADNRRLLSNPLALAVLATLRERPMHPYEMAASMRSRGKERSIKLNYGSLYTVVNNLAKHGLIEALEASRDGRRPERTTYQLTSAGLATMEEWLISLLDHPVKEYPQFEAALSLMSVLGPDRVHDALARRVTALETAIAGEQAEIAGVASWLPRLFLLESEYHLAMQEAELAWVRGLADELGRGSFPGVADWAHWHQTGELPGDLSDRDQAAMEQAMQAAGGSPGPETADRAGEGAAGPS